MMRLSLLEMISGRRLIGLTLCALAHELGGTHAVQQFTRHLAPRFFNGSPELIDTLEMQLFERDTLRKILNEGSSRGFTELFIRAASSSPIPLGDIEWMKEHGAYVDSAYYPEAHLVSSFLRWLGEESSTAYFTRSGLVARIAIYLKTVGYMIGQITSWDGQGNAPAEIGQNAVVLVLGGCHPTDQFWQSEDDEGFINATNTFHYYTSRTVGSLLFNALGVHLNTSPESLQDDFDVIHSHISHHMSVRWYISQKEKRTVLELSCEWQKTPESSSVETAIACIYFPRSGHLLAPCFRRIASDELLEQLRDGFKEGETVWTKNLSPELMRFRAVTACIVISVISRLAPDTFGTTQHKISIRLVSETWLELVCLEVDRFASGRIGLGPAVLLLASIHAGREPYDEKHKEKAKNATGYRDGSFSVLPKLLEKMEPCTASVGLSCSDRFFANLAVSDDGQIDDCQSPGLFSDLSTPISTIEEGSSSVQSLQKSWTGRPHISTPDRPLYLSLERVPFGNSTHIGFTGRIDGSVVGRTSIRDVLWTLLRSSEVAKSCSHDSSDGCVQNMKASQWVLEPRSRKPVGLRETPIYIPVKGDKCWTLFLAGHARSLNGVVMYRCVECTKALLCKAYASAVTTHAVLVGYNG
jgi:hypothetical protein